MVKKTKVPAPKKRKGEEFGFSAGAKKQATGSSERTRSEVPLPRTLLSPSRAVEAVDVAGLRKLTATSASSEPEGVESAIEDYNHVSNVILRLLQGSVSKYNRAARKVRDLAEDKARLSSELAAATVQEEKLREQLGAAKSELSATKEKVAEMDRELEASRSREEEIAVVQGDVLRALAERIFLSKKFSALVVALSKPTSTRAVAKVLDHVATDFPELEKGKYGHKEIKDEEMLRIYFRELTKKTSGFLVVEHLTTKRTLLTVEEVRECPVDRDVEFEALLRPFREELKTHPLSPDVSDEEEEEEEEEEEDREAATPGQVNADTEAEKTAEVQQSSSVVNEADLSGRVS